MSNAGRDELWERLRRLDAARWSEIAMLLVFTARLHVQMRRAIVDPMVRRLEDDIGKHFAQSPSGPRRMDVTPESAKRLSTETVLALLPCCQHPEQVGRHLNYLDPTMFLRLVESISGSARPAEPEGEPPPYDRDPDVARTQLLLRWMRILGVPNPRFVAILNEIGFADRWDSCTATVIPETLAAIRRANAQMVLDEAYQGFENLDGRGRQTLAQAIDWVAGH